MFERFTERARIVVTQAQEQARELHHNYIGTEHLLLGLIAEEHGLAARTLKEMGVTLEETQEHIKRVVGFDEETPAPQTPFPPFPFTPRAKKTLELGLREAISLGHSYIGTEHLLLGLLRDEGVGMRILLDFKLDADKIRNEVIRNLSGPEQPKKKKSDEPEPAPDLKEIRDAVEAMAETVEKFTFVNQLNRIENKLDIIIRFLSERDDPKDG